MKLKKLLVTNLVISSVALTASGVALGMVYVGEDNTDSVVYECTCPVEEPTESTESTEPSAITEPTIPTESTDIADIIYLGEFKLTAYCPCAKCCGQWADGITSTGVTAKAGRTIAVDPTVIPYGSLVEINGNTYVAEDCGGSIKGNRIDVYFNTHEEALEFGVQYADVYIVGSE